MALFAGVLGFGFALAVMTTINAYSVSLSSLSIALAAVVGSLFGMFVVGSVSAWRVRRKLGEHYSRLDGAINNMIQGLCMFDAKNRLVVWNQRYIDMYRIDPTRVWRGCTIGDLLEARIAAGSLPLDAERYEIDLYAAVKQGKTFTMTVEVGDGRIIRVINQPMESGGWVATHEDVTEYKIAKRELEQTRSFLDTIIENVPSPIIVKGAQDLRYLLINRAAEQYLGIDRTTMLGKRAIDVMPAATAGQIEEQDRRLIAAGTIIFRDEHAVATPGNGTRIVTTTRIPVNGNDGKPQYLISVVRDLTDRKRNEQRIAHMAHHDPLTELPNRAAFTECIDATIDLAARSGESFAVLCLDLDRFKSVNDVFGHSAGDTLLREVVAPAGGGVRGRLPRPRRRRRVHRHHADRRAARNCRAARRALLCGARHRYRGRRQSDARRLDHRRRHIPAGRRRRGHAARQCRRRAVPRQIGSARLGALLRAVDGQAAARAARAATGPAQRGRARGTRSALPAAGPYRRRDHRLRGAGALASSALRAGARPSTFIPLAEETGIIVALGEWVLRSACREAASWPKPLRVAVNLSPVQFQRGDLAKLVHEILLETGLSPSRLELEITEGVLIGDFSGAVATLRRLKNLGVRIAMDDFGTGYSSLSYLQSFPFDKIKIDQSFVANLAHSRQAVTIIRAVIALGRGLDLPVVAEGVETQEQLTFLAGEQCSEIQGYFVGRPLPIEEYADVVGRTAVARRNAFAVAG